MRQILIILLALLTAKTVQAQFIFLSDNRSVSASGLTEDTNLNVTGSYSQTNTPLEPFADFNDRASGSTISSASTATQNSTLTPFSILSSGGAGVDVRSGSYGGGAWFANAQANSTFEISFIVESPLPYSFSAFQDIEAAGGFVSFRLSSVNHGDIFSTLTESTFYNNYLNYSGGLQPDVYTLEAQEEMNYTAGGNTYDGGGMTYNMTLNAPEPKLLGPFVALTFSAALLLKRKLAKA